MKHNENWYNLRERLYELPDFGFPRMCIHYKEI